MIDVRLQGKYETDTHYLEYINKLLSSELSLAVKMLRESALIMVKHDPYQECCSCYTDVLSAFDSKAKEILGESS